MENFSNTITILNEVMDNFVDFGYCQSSNNQQRYSSLIQEGNYSSSRSNIYTLENNDYQNTGSLSQYATFIEFDEYDNGILSQDVITSFSEKKTYFTEDLKSYPCSEDASCSYSLHILTSQSQQIEINNQVVNNSLSIDLDQNDQGFKPQFYLVGIIETFDSSYSKENHSTCISSLVQDILFQQNEVFEVQSLSVDPTTQY